MGVKKKRVSKSVRSKQSYERHEGCGGLSGDEDRTAEACGPLSSLLSSCSGIGKVTKEARDINPSGPHLWGFLQTSERPVALPIPGFVGWGG